MKLIDLVNEIAAAEISVSRKVIRLWAIAMLDYRGHTGERAWDRIRDLIGADATTALSFLTGFSAGTIPTEDKLRSLVPELEDGKPFTR